MLAVTTRNELRSWRYSLPMMRARGYVREQLAATPGLFRYVSAIASPTEFLTMTVWENPAAALECWYCRTSKLLDSDIVASCS